MELLLGLLGRINRDWLIMLRQVINESHMELG